MTIDSRLEIGRWDEGFLIRVVGHGTLNTSPAFKEFVIQCLAHRGARVVVDLSDCEYLDSTFLGCLIGMQKRCVRDPERFLIAADRAVLIRLFSISVLDDILPLTDGCPPCLGAWMPLAPADLATDELGRHVMESHRALAALPCPEAPKFLAVAQRLADELWD